MPIVVTVFVEYFVTDCNHIKQDVLMLLMQMLCIHVFLIMYARMKLFIR